MDKKTMRNKVLLIAVLLMFLGNCHVSAQQKGALYLGLSPDITTEKEYGKGEFDLNVLPIVIQYYLNNTVAIRVSSTVNLHIGNGTEIAQVGGQVAIPVYFLSKSSSAISGIYLAPLGGMSHNYISASNEITTAAEAGYTWNLPGGFTMNLGLQLGGTYFTAEDETAGWRNHSGIKFSLGYTFRKGRQNN